VASGKQLPSRARVVVIGGGVGGTSVAYHLATMGETDVILLDRSDLTSGSTFHSAGLVGQLRSDPTLTRMNMYSVELYRHLQDTDTPPGWVETGSIRLASSPERLEEIRRQVGWARAQGMDLVEISANEAQELFPLMSTDGVLGGAYMRTDGQVDPSQLTFALAAGARAAGVQIFTQTRVTAIETENGRVTKVRTDDGDIECEIVVNCGGMFAPEIGRLAGVRVPIIPMSHQYVVTEAFLPRSDKPLPSLRDPDLLVYYRQEVDGLVMGGYERQSLAWQTTDFTYDAIPPDFNGRLLPEDWDRFIEITENAQVRVPALANVGVRKLINGPEGFTPDNEFCLGETEVGGLFVAAGFCAHGIAGAGGIGKVMAEWIIGGEPTMDLWHMDIRRFGRQYTSPSLTMQRTVENYESYYDIRYPGEEREAGRPLRVPPAYSWHKENGASFGEKSMWERVNYYESNAADGNESLRPIGWAGRFWSPAVEAEHVSTRTTAGLFDQSSFAKIEVSGADAVEFVQHVFANNLDRPIGRIVYTQALNERGGIEMDVTVTRLEPNVFLIITGTAFGSHDLGWLRTQARRLELDVRIADVTGQFATICLWGPNARTILESVTPFDVSHATFGYMTSRDITVGEVPVRAARVTYVGELGWELYCSAEYGLALWTTLINAGAAHGLRPAGYRAIESLRLEKGYRAWATDITPETNPFEAGLGFAVSFTKPQPFIGRAALEELRDKQPALLLRALVLTDPHTVAQGGEPVRIDGKIVGRVTSGGYGYTVGHPIAYAYLPSDLAEGTAIDVEVFGTWASGTIGPDPLFDPAGERIRA
jgi:4-methylaminobutanoate oxidase (formaldehyde-forming)